MTDIVIPNSFVSGTTAVAADVNENFEAIEDFVNLTGVPKVQDGVITHANMSDKTLGQQVSGGFDKQASASSGNGDKMDITVSGDGSTVMSIWVQGHVSHASGAAVSVEIRDAAGGGGTRYYSISVPCTTASASYPFSFTVPIAAFSGSRTFYMRIVSTGTPSLDVPASGPAYMRAIWTPGYGT